MCFINRFAEKNQLISNIHRSFEILLSLIRKILFEQKYALTVIIRFVHYTARQLSVTSWLNKYISFCEYSFKGL